MGHLLFEHTFLSSLMGGMLHGAGPVSVPWALVFRRWRRAAQITADRISLLACGQLEVALRTLIKTETGAEDDSAELDAVLDRVYDRDRPDLSTRVGETLGAYPSLVSRVRALVDFDAELFARDVEDWLAEDGLN